MSLTTHAGEDCRTGDSCEIKRGIHGPVGDEPKETECQRKFCGLLGRQGCRVFIRKCCLWNDERRLLGQNAVIYRYSCWKIAIVAHLRRQSLSNVWVVDYS
jgi:hypothetical protein